MVRKIEFEIRPEHDPKYYVRDTIGYRGIRKFGSIFGLVDYLAEASQKGPFEVTYVTGLSNSAEKKKS